MPELEILDHAAVLAAVSPAAAIDHVREAFLRHHHGEWAMPAKVYLPSPPYGDFRAMPALGGELAMLKWISSFPGNPAAEGLPAVMGVVCVSDARTSRPLAILDAGAVTALRTGAVAAVAAHALARDGAQTVGIVGSGLHGGWAARCLAAAGYGPGVCCDARPEAAEALAAELAGLPQAALRADRASAHAQAGHDVPEAMAAELERARAALEEARAGAARFAAGAGRGGPRPISPPRRR